MITICRSYILKRLCIVHKDTTFAGSERDEWWASLHLIIKPSIFVQGLVKQVREFEEIEYVATHLYYYKLLMTKQNMATFLKRGYMSKKRGYNLQPRFFRPCFLVWHKTCDYRTNGPMAALFKRSPRPGPMATFKTRPKAIATFKTWLQVTTIAAFFKCGCMTYFSRV